MRGAAAHVVAVIAPPVVVGDEPGVRFGLELADRGEVATMEGGAPALFEYGALKTLADTVVVGRGWARVPNPLATRCFCTVALAMENPGSPSASMTWVGVASGIAGLRLLLGMRASSP